MTKKKTKKRIESLLESLEKQNSESRRLLRELCAISSEGDINDIESNMSQLALISTSGEIDRDEIKIQVLAAIDAEAARNSASGTNRVLLRAGQETLKLEDDLNINLTRRKALSIDYSNISESYDGGKFAGPNASASATTVKKAINLVLKKAKGE